MDFLTRHICILAGHKWKRIGGTKFIQDNPFNNKGEPMAYGECERCGIRKPRPAYGTFAVPLYNKTTEEAIAEWEEEIE